jgi:hypothetical protein
MLLAIAVLAALRLRGGLKMLTTPNGVPKLPDTCQSPGGSVL